jgi:hypothetical protein
MKHPNCDCASGMDCDVCGEYTKNCGLNRMNPPPFDELICCDHCVDCSDNMKMFVRGYERGLYGSGV